MARHSAILSLFAFSMVVMNVSTEMFPSVIDPFASESALADAEKEEKIVIRSKRQQCICVAVMFQDSEDLQNMRPASNYQCACDPTPTKAGQYTSPLRQQQDLQRELQIAKGIANQCGCQLIASRMSTTTTMSPIFSGNSIMQPVYDCQCYPTATQSYIPPTTTTTTTQAPTTTTYMTPKPQSIVIPLQIQQAGQSVCQCFEIEVELTQQRQFQCDCGNGATYYAAPGMLPTTSRTTTTTPPTTTTTTTTTTPTPRTLPTFFITTTVPPAIATTKEAPDAMPCVMVRIQTGEQACACQENYRQCTENVCCNVQKFRSLKTPTPSTVDLLVDFLQKVRQSFTV